MTRIQLHTAYREFVLSVCLSIFSLTIMAQTGVNSPYSRYGFGLMSDRAMGFNKAMGGVAQGFRNGQEINPANPASYSAVDSLTALFDLGMSVYNGNYDMGNLKQNARNASFDYFAFQFRARKHLGLAVGILPYTNIDYSFTSSSEQLDGNENISSAYGFTGSGGLHKVFLGLGWQPIKYLSVGVNGGYLYGDYTHTSTMSFTESSAYSLVRGYNADISTYMLDFGLQAIIPFDNKNNLTIGATYGLGHEVKNKAYRYTETLNSSSSIQGITRDTIQNAFELPHTIAFGAAFTHATKWRIGADFELEKWSQSKFPANNVNSNVYYSAKGQLYDRMKIALGAELTPNALSRNYWNHVTYKLGGYYQQSYAKTDISGTISDKPTEFGISAGASFPIQNRHIWYNSPRIHVTFSWVHTDIPYLSSSTNIQNSLKENYLKLSLGITFSERWFYKWKVE